MPNSYRVRSLRASQGRRRDRRDQSDYSPGRVHPAPRRTCMPFHRGRAVRRDFRRPATMIAPRTVPHHRIPNCLVGGLLTQRHFNCGEVVPSRVEGDSSSKLRFIAGCFRFSFNGSVDRRGTVDPGASKQSLQARLRKPSGTGPDRSRPVRMPSTRRASMRTRLVLRMCSGKFRMSSPSAISISNA